jgi:hypothetical protein
MRAAYEARSPAASREPGKKAIELNVYGEGLPERADLERQLESIELIAVAKEECENAETESRDLTAGLTVGQLDEKARDLKRVLDAADVAVASAVAEVNRNGMGEQGAPEYQFLHGRWSDVCEMRDVKTEMQECTNLDIEEDTSNGCGGNLQSDG